jgi:hypothetical protein
VIGGILAMLDKQEVENKMKERGFTAYCYVGLTKIQFVSSHMYDMNYEEKTPPRKRMPIINIIVDLKKEEFQCIYNIKQSINTLNTPTCGSVLNDDHFDNIVCKFETQAKWLEKIF